MDTIYFSNEFPKEALQDVFRQLHKESKSSTHHLLARFMSEATRAVKKEIEQLPSSLKQIIPPFETLSAWAESKELREGELCGAIDGVLLVLLQISVYICHAEAGAELPTAPHLSALGVGLIGAAAVAMSKELSDLPSYGAQAVAIAFRMGVHVQGVSHQLEARELDETPKTWAYVVHNIDPKDAQAELEAFHEANLTSKTASIFISAVSRTSVTISGPPSKLETLFKKSKVFRDARSIALPVYGGLCHAPSVYSTKDTQKIMDGLNTSTSATLSSQAPQAPLYSTSTGKPYEAANASGLFSCVVTELLSKAIEWDQVISGLVSAAKSAGVTEVKLFCFGNSIPLNDLKTALQAAIADVKITIPSFMTVLKKNATNGAPPRGTAQSKLAIVGMSCRLPGGATDTEKFWELLEAGLDVSRKIPASRFDIETHYDPEGKDLNKTMTQYGCFIDEPGMFDPSFFNMSPREAMAVDPQMRLSLVTAYEALEKAGFVGNRTLSTKLQRIGTFYGQAADDYREVNQGQEVGTYYIPGGCRAFGPGRINYFFKFAGPSYSVDTACSSGLAAIEVACQALWNGEVDMAVAGGVNILTNPDGFAGLCRGHFLTKGQNACKTWDATADGYCRAEGVGSIVIKRLEDAEADNDNILGVVLAAGTNHSAEAVSITHPHAGHQSYLSRQILRQAGVDPLDISYIELHGTGTQAGDFEELKGVLDVYAPNTSPSRRADQVLHIGSSKSNVGHGESVAGTTALIKVLLMLQKNAIPRHIGIKTEINPRLPTDLDQRNVVIPFSNTPWAPGKRVAAVNNFGAAGGNTMMILEEAPARPERQQKDPRQTHVVTLSAKTKASLRGNIERLLAHLERDETVTLEDLAYTTTARKYHHSYRVAIAASDLGSVKKQLTSQLNKIDALKPVNKTNPPSVAFAFTGQGASYQSMNLELYRDVPVFREHIHTLDKLAQAQGFPSFIPAIDGSHPKEYVHAPVITQLALVCLEIALAHYWASLGIKPDVVVGHSLGEYAAMHVAGVISANDAIFMVGSRALMLMEKCQSGSHCMMAVRASLENIIANSGGKPHTVACINGPADTVLSGTKAQMDDIAKDLEAAGLRCIKLDVAFAFHSEQTDPILDEFEAISKSGVVFHEPKLPIISPLLGKVIFDGHTLNANYVRTATREAVDFVSAMRNASSISTIGDDTVWIEIGPHPVCVGFIKTTLPSTRLAVPSLRRGDSNWKTMSESAAALHLAGVNIDWNELHRPFTGQVRLLELPTYAWDEKNYWMQYNGDWCLTKGNTFYEKKQKAIEPTPRNTKQYQSLGSLVQNIISVNVEGEAGSVVMQSDLMQKEFLEAASGHRMNDNAVVTSSIHADIAYTLGDYLYRKFYPKAKRPDMDMANLEVTKALIAKKKDMDTPQSIQVTAATTDIRSGVLDLTWQNVEADGSCAEPFATAQIIYGDAKQWLSSWSPMSHLIQSRIETLERLAVEGQANRLSRNLAYTLFSSNLVDYADKYRGMQSVVMNDLEAFAEVKLTEKPDSGTYAVPPYYVDSVAHLAGFIMNCSDSIDTKNNYCVTSGWKSMRFAEPMTPGARYRSYVKMIPTKDDPAVFLGDVYILKAEDNSIVGMVGGIHFRRFPRILLNRFFSAPEPAKATSGQQAKPAPVKAAPAPAAPKPVAQKAVAPAPKAQDFDAQSSSSSEVTPPGTPLLAASANTSSTSINVIAAEPAKKAGNGIMDKALDIIANETAIDLADLEDDADFANLGIDSLMSLVLVEKFQKELDVKVNGSLFLDYPTIGDLREWLEKYYG
ncbi:Polyketide synthase modules [Pyrenophora tritici-repentis]|uniref:Conidial yellow pigment biosynthesis polyketide synthase n=2 Tax=Pyrenophora tritici-repentis TaxID=45151 RepID=A0A2W1EPM5_9PLEO|nr:conidial yellow pigment biosynthesis polyketide synthase [Pyrenophora tritici-repentis Pt-1C-BFP]KAA8623229.1 Conidial yellow pigment biosynthesis polyketide synthase [Pyrenophora tritici-repentis]EDU45231.1 conidial yellow pigment biosynthesis polyketide synthase [Pyrenophora tritici-repentis Pt-1C-BFP]KAF7452225.1 Conidial yellow pigment biosynthesis polyketide synthase [Pyrenophora tritici-repentis]KAF7574656.1 Polyketide synthase module protein [Pyrenophora tritici-repentis]KAG9386568.1